MTGLPCQRWDSQTPHSHHYNDVNAFPDASITDVANYCRDPDNVGFLWCYTTNSTIRWQPCAIDKCKHTLVY